MNLGSVSSPQLMANVKCFPTFHTMGYHFPWQYRLQCWKKRILDWSLVFEYFGSIHRVESTKRVIPVIVLSFLLGLGMTFIFLSFTGHKTGTKRTDYDTLFKWWKSQLYLWGDAWYLRDYDFNLLRGSWSISTGSKLLFWRWLL